MKKIVLISCARKKLPVRARASDLYVSPLFRLNLQYALSLKPDNVFILSAKHGLVALDEQIDTYEVTLNNMKSSEVKIWASNVMAQVKEKVDPNADHFVFLAGERYRKHLLPKLSSYEIPMLGLPIGRQLQFLKQALSSSEC